MADLNDQFDVTGAGGITDNDRLMAALSYPIPIVALIILIAEDMKKRPFQRFHAVQALAVNIALWVIIVLLGCLLSVLTLGLCSAGPGLLWFITLYWAYEAYQGKYFEIPYLTQFLRNQKWL